MNTNSSFKQYLPFIEGEKRIPERMLCKLQVDDLVMTSTMKLLAPSHISDGILLKMVDFLNKDATFRTSIDDLKDIYVLYLE